ncbi:MAG: 6-phosphogluconolactonase [Candidatus Aminicenantes bacterium]|nr:6-phosphogluconolactonase [Candidatus Aminicenantes bacterium]
MIINISQNAAGLGAAAARFAGEKLREAVARNGEARLVLSTGSSQFETLEALLKEDVDWKKTEIFHLDEYISLPVTHKASFRRYLKERFVNFIECRKFHSVDTEGNVGQAIAGLTDEIRNKPVDVGLIGIGENGHIAFNDPPADFDTREAYIEVTLDERCKRQQVGEGWFESVDDVPEKAISMTAWQIMQCRTIVSCVPHLVKAEAVYKTLTSKLSNMIPATMLKQHLDFNLFIDYNSASKVITF